MSDISRAFQLCQNGAEAELASMLQSRSIDAAACQTLGLYSGWSLLHAAASKGHMRIVQMLLDAGAPASACNPQSKTPAQVAHDKGHSAVAALLQQAEKALEVALEVDSFIRNRHDFDTLNPTQYWCEINAIERELESIEPGSDLRQLLHEFAGTMFEVSGGYVRLRHLTPFQGESSHPVFGHFRCSNCERPWQSGASWKDSWQQCSVCETHVYPHEQREPEKPSRDGRDPQAPHDMKRCQRCCEMGRDCRGSR